MGAGAAHHYFRGPIVTNLFMILTRRDQQRKKRREGMINSQNRKITGFPHLYFSFNTEKMAGGPLGL